MSAAASPSIPDQSSQSIGNYEEWKRTFANVSSYLVRIDVKDVSIQGDVARAKCSVTYSPVPKPAGRQRPDHA